MSYARVPRVVGVGSGVRERRGALTPELWFGSHKSRKALSVSGKRLSSLHQPMADAR